MGSSATTRPQPGARQARVWLTDSSLLAVIRENLKVGTQSEDGPWCEHHQVFLWGKVGSSLTKLLHAAVG